MHTHGNDPKVVQVGKLLIVRSILDAERKSTLYVRDPNNQDSIDFERGERNREGEEIVPPPKRSWLGELFRLLVAEKEYADFYKALQNIAFVSFNYDRCIEQYLLYTARQYFRLTPENVADLNSVIEVIHPYGSIGELNVQGGTIRGFGKTVDYRELIDIADGIRTFTEQIVEKTKRERIFERFHNCQVAIFLGFAFLPLNMKLLFGDNRFQIPDIIGTTFGISAESKGIIEEELCEAMVLGDQMEMGDERDSQVRLSPVTCRELFVQSNRFLQGNG